MKSSSMSFSQWSLFLYIVCRIIFSQSTVKKYISYNFVDFSMARAHDNFIANFFFNANSGEWISSPKLKNKEDPLLHPDSVHELILYDSPNNLVPLETTICSSNSRFMGRPRYHSNISEGGDHKQQLSFSTSFFGYSSPPTSTRTKRGTRKARLLCQ